MASWSGESAGIYRQADYEEEEKRNKIFNYLATNAGQAYAASGAVSPALHVHTPTFFGGAAQKLGLLDEPVTAKVASQLHMGFGPKGERLRQNAGDDRDAAFEVTLSVSKSVSLRALLGSDADRAEIQEALNETVQQMGRLIEERLTFTRRGHKGRTIERAAGLVMHAYVHVSSRYGDPQLHVHLMIENFCLRQDGSWGALHSLPLYQAKMAMGALATADFAARLKARGFALRKSRHGFEVRGVSDAMCQHFSKGRNKILKIANKLGLDSAKAMDAINQRIRPAKKATDPQAQVEGWRREAEEHGFTLGNQRRYERAMDFGRMTIRARRAVRGAVRQLAERTSSYTATQVLELAARACPMGQARMEDLLRATDHVLAHDSGIYPLGIQTGEARFSGKAGVLIEQRALRIAGESRAKTDGIVAPKIWERVAKEAGLDVEQREALAHLVGTPGGIKLLQGAAGTGKTYVQKAVVAAAQANGGRVFGVTPTGFARHGLASGAKIQEAFTMDGFAMRIDSSVGRQAKHHLRMFWRAARGKSTWRLSSIRLRRGDYVIVDEAAMVGFRGLALLIEKAAKAGARIILVGDEKQLGPVQAGASLFSELKDRLGAAQLTKNWRQAEPWMQLMSQRLRDGEPEAALRLLIEQQRLHISREFGSPLAACVESYMKLPVADRSETAIIASTRRSVRALNAEIQARRLAAKEIRRSATKLKAPRERDAGDGDAELAAIKIHVGDRVVLRRNNAGVPVHRKFVPFVGTRAEAGGVSNGDSGEVVAAYRKQLRVRLDRTATNGARLFATIDLKQYPHVDLGYAKTTHCTQGHTVRRTLLFADPGRLDAQLGYVAMTRHTDDLHVFAHEFEVGKELTDFARGLKRSRREELVATLERQRQQEEAQKADRKQNTSRKQARGRQQEMNL